MGSFLGFRFRVPFWGPFVVSLSGVPFWAPVLGSGFGVPFRGRVPFGVIFRGSPMFGVGVRWESLFHPHACAGQGLAMTSSIKNGTRSRSGRGIGAEMGVVKAIQGAWPQLRKPRLFPGVGVVWRQVRGGRGPSGVT